MSMLTRTMKSILLGIGLSILACGSTSAQETTIIESAYSVAPSRGQGYKVNVAIVASNPYDDKFASYPEVRVTLRAANGSIITTQEINSAGIPPKSKIAFCKGIYADEMPARVDIRPLSAGYEPTIFRAWEFLPFTLLSISAKPDQMGRLRITGEIKNPYRGETGAWITFLFRDSKGKLLGGHTTYESTIPPGEPSAFETYIDADDAMQGVKSIEQIAFSHNNFQSSWQKLLRQ
jgi:hypothetical protein